MKVFRFIHNLTNPNYNKPFTLLLWGRLVSQLGDKLYLLALPWLVLDLTHSAAQSAITLALETLPIIILAPFIGVYVDRISRKLLMISTDFLRGVIVGLISFLAIIDRVEMLHIYLAAFLLSALTLAFDSSSQGFLAHVVAKEKLVEANAALTFINTLMRLAGPVLSGIFITAIGAPGTIGLNALSFFLSGLILSFLPMDRISTELKTKGATIFSDIKEGFSYLFNHQILLPIALFSTAMNVGINLVSTLLIFESKESLGYTSNETAIIFWVSGITTSLAVLLLKPLKKVMDKGQMIRYGSLGVLLSILILIYQQSLATITISYSLIMMVGVIVNVNMMAYRQEIIPNHLFGRVMTSSRVLVSAFTPLAMIASGFLATLYSARFVFIVAAVIISINVLYAWFSRLRHIR